MNSVSLKDSIRKIFVVLFAIEDHSNLSSILAMSSPMTKLEPTQRTEISATDLIHVSSPTPASTGSIVPVTVYDYVTRVAVRQPQQYLTPSAFGPNVLDGVLLRAFWFNSFMG